MGANGGKAGQLGSPNSKRLAKNENGEMVDWEWWSHTAKKEARDKHEEHKRRGDMLWTCR